MTVGVFSELIRGDIHYWGSLTLIFGYPRSSEGAIAPPRPWGCTLGGSEMCLT
jgi:hypothetical protein